MKTIYFVTEGNTDKIVLQGLIEDWMGAEDFVARHIQPPSSEFLNDLDSNLSNGWKGVVAWCRGDRPVGPAGRDVALTNADCIVIHTDADVAFDPSFKNPALSPPSTATAQCNFVRSHLASLLPKGELPPNVVLCVPAQDLEAWVLTALHLPDSDANTPIEEYPKPALLLPKKPYKLTRYQDGELKKLGAAYSSALNKIIKGWSNCTEGSTKRCPQAIRFEREARSVLHT